MGERHGKVTKWLSELTLLPKCLAYSESYDGHDDGGDEEEGERAHTPRRAEK